MGELDRTNAGDHIFNWPSLSQNVEKFKTRRTDMKAIRNRIRDLCTIHIEEKFGIEEIGMIC